MANGIYDSIRLIINADPRTRYYTFDSIAISGTKKTSYPTITINVKDKSNGNDLSGINVKIPQIDTLTTDASGNVSFQVGTPLENVEYIISEEIDGYTTLSSSFDIFPATPDTTINVTLDPAYNATFNVTDTSMSPVSGATISLDGYGDSITDGTGSITYYDIAESDSLYYSVMATGYDTYEDSIQIAGSSITEDITMIEAYNVNITVMETDGTPVDMADVTLDGEDTLQTDYTGTATFSEVLVSDSTYYGVTHSLFTANNDSVKVVDATVYDTIYVSPTDKVIWYESFNTEGAKIDSGSTAWEISGSISNSSVIEGKLVGRDKGMEFSSEKIAIDSSNGISVDAVNLSIDIDHDGHAADACVISYSVDGATPDTIYNSGGTNATTVSKENIQGDSLEVFIFSHSNVTGRWKQYNDLLIEAVTAAPVADIIPADSATGISVDTTIIVSFDQHVQQIGGAEITDPASLITFKETDDSGADVVFSATINATKDTIEVTLAAELANGQTYYVAVEPVQNVWGETTSPTSSTFTTIMTAPALVSTTPADAETDVATDVTVTAKMDQAISDVDLTGITVIDGSANDVFSNASITDSTVTINNSALDNDETYTVTIPAGAMQNSDGLTNSQITWSFTTTIGVSIDNVIENDNISVGPNPAKDILTVIAPQGAVITLYDVLGAPISRVKSQNNTTEIDVSDLNASVVVVQVNDDGKVITRKIIIE